MIISSEYQIQTMTREKASSCQTRHNSTRDARVRMIQTEIIRMAEVVAVGRLLIRMIFAQSKTGLIS